MTGVLIGLIVVAALWVVLFILLLLFSGGELDTALGGATFITVALAAVAGVVAGAAWLISLVTS